MGHHDGNGDDVQSGQRRRHAFVVEHYAMEARHPGEPALDNPAPGQQDEAPRGRRQLDHCQAHALSGGFGCRLRTGVALLAKATSTASPVTS